jgi:DHA1 family multidrug resistance protein-like MFS transporter
MPTHAQEASGRSRNIQDADDEDAMTKESPKPSPPRIHIRGLLLAIVIVAGCAELAYTVVNISAMPVYITTIPLDPRWIGIAATAFILVEGLLKSPFGLLGDRVGRKILILAGPSVSIFTCVLTPHVHNPYLLILLRILDGIGAAALWPSAFSLIGDHVPESRRASAMSLFNLAYLTGLALGPLLGGGINDWTYQRLFHSHHALLHTSKEASFYLAAILFALTTIVATLALPNVKPVHHIDPEAIEGGFNFADFKKMLGRMPTTLLMTFVTFLGIGLVMAYFKIFAMHQFRMSESEFGALLIGPALIIAALSVPLGTLGDRIGKARAVKIGIGLCTFAYWMLIIFFGKGTLIGFGALLGIGFVIAFPAWMALITQNCDPKQRGAVVGAVGTSQGLGAIFGVVTSSFLYKIGAFKLGPISIPEHGVPFLGCALMLALSFVLALLTVHDTPLLPAASEGLPAQ